MAHLTFNNFGPLVSNPNSFYKPSVCSTMNKFEALTNGQPNLFTADDIDNKSEPKHEKEFWNAVLRASLALEKAIQNPDQGWMVYK
jgi:hypothetical protein